METGLVIAGVPAFVGMVLLECWRRRTVRRYRVAERRALRQREAWEALTQLEEAA